LLTNINTDQKTQSVSLFDSRVVVVRPRPSTMAGSYVARRFRVDPAVADLYASLAGLGELRS
jgi:hypothetical protein